MEIDKRYFRPTEDYLEGDASKAKEKLNGSKNFIRV